MCINVYTVLLGDWWHCSLFAQVRVIWEKRALLGKTSSPDWPADKPAEHFLSDQSEGAQLAVGVATLDKP